MWVVVGGIVEHIPNKELEDYIGKEVGLELYGAVWAPRFVNDMVQCSTVTIEVVDRSHHQDEHISFRGTYPDGSRTQEWIINLTRYRLHCRFYPLSNLPARTNKGSIKCWKCKCPTELRRDFADMTVREFCPRCKV